MRCVPATMRYLVVGEFLVFTCVAFRSLYIYHPARAALIGYVLNVSVTFIWFFLIQKTFLRYVSRGLGTEA
jgi:hypothetical protein